MVYENVGDHDDDDDDAIHPFVPPFLFAQPCTPHRTKPPRLWLRRVSLLTLTHQLFAHVNNAYVHTVFFFSFSLKSDNSVSVVILEPT